MTRSLRKLLPSRLLSKKSQESRSNRRCKPYVESLEDRSLPSTTPFLITPDHLYNLNGNLSDDFGGPNLQSEGGLPGPQRYDFNNNQGLLLSGALADPDSYTIVMSLRIEESTSSFQKLIDFKNLAVDDGLYVANSKLQLYPESSGSSTIPFSIDFNLTVSRDGQSDEVAVYFNDLLEATYLPPGSDVAFPGDNPLWFFKDDNATNGFEAPIGSVDYIAIYNQPLTPLEIFGGTNEPPTIQSDQSSVVVSEGELAASSGTWNDADGDEVTLSASVGTVEKLPDGTWAWSFDTTDGPDESQTVTITANDGLNDSQSTSFELTVNNVAPSVSIGDPFRPDHFYDLNGTFDDQMGGSALTGDEELLGTDGFFFSNNQGLQLSDALQDTGTYSVVILMELNSLSPPFKKIIDFQEGNLDDGLYILNNHFHLFPGPSGPDTVAVNTPFQVVLTRDGQTGEASLYLDGVLQNVYTGATADVVLPTENVFRFFQDDSATGGTEAPQGFADYIAVYDRALASDEVADLILPRQSNVPASTEINVEQGELAVNSGIWNDPGDDEVLLSASVGTVTKNSDGSWEWEYDTTNGAGGTQTVVITATDSDGDFSETTFQLTVSNPEPIITSLSSDHSSIKTASEDGSVTIKGTFIDLGAGNPLTGMVDWGDGTIEPLPAGAIQNGEFHASHNYAHGGIFKIRVTLTDSDGDQATEKTRAVVEGIGLVNGKLFVIGTDETDFVNIKRIYKRGKKGASVLKVVLKSFNGERTKTVETFDPSEVKKIVIFTRADNDWIWIHRNVRKKLKIFGGPGWDFVFFYGC